MSLKRFQALNFHQKCDNASNTVTIIKSSNGYVFGGFTSLKWDSVSSWKKDNDAFIFSLINEQNISQKIHIKSDMSQNGIFCNQNYGPSFGRDFLISYSSNCTNCSSNLGWAYNYLGANNEAFLAGAKNFLTNEIEVFTVNFT